MVRIFVAAGASVARDNGKLLWCLKITAAVASVDKTQAVPNSIALTSIGAVGDALHRRIACATVVIRDGNCSNWSCTLKF